MLTGNSTHCVHAFELRRRGADVAATDLPRRFWTSGGRTLGDLEQAWGRRFTPATRAELDAAFASPGARGFVAVLWDNGVGGHVFSAENVRGRVRYLDPQSGTADVQGWLARSRSARYLRTDDLPTPATTEFCGPS